MRALLSVAALSILALVSCAKPAVGNGPAAGGTSIPASGGPSSIQSGAPSEDSLTAAAAKAGFQTPSSPIKALDFTLPSLDGSTVSLKALQGSVVLVNFWATWCPPCKAEIPSLEKLYSQYKSKGLKVLAIDVAEDKTTVSAFVSANKMETTILLDASGQTAGAYGAQSIPLTYIIAKDGSVVGRTLGARDWTSPEVLSLMDALVAAR